MKEIFQIWSIDPDTSKQEHVEDFDSYDSAKDKIEENIGIYHEDNTEFYILKVFRKNLD